MIIETLNWEDIYETLLANNTNTFKSIIDTWRIKITRIEPNNELNTLIHEYWSRQHTFVSERFSRTRLNRNRFLGHIYSLFHLCFDSKYSSYLDYYISTIKVFQSDIKKMLVEIDVSYIFNFIANPYFSIVDLNDYFYLAEDFMNDRQMHNKLWNQFVKQKATSGGVEKIIVKFIQEMGLKIQPMGVNKFVDSPFVDYFSMLTNNKALVLMFKKAIRSEQMTVVDDIKEEIEYRFVHCINSYCEETLHCDMMNDMEEDLGISMKDELDITEDEKRLYDEILFRKLKTYISLEDKLSLGVERVLVGRLGLHMPFRKLEEILKPIIVYIRDKTVLKDIVKEVYDDSRLIEIVEMVYDKLTADL